MKKIQVLRITTLVIGLLFFLISACENNDMLQKPAPTISENLVTIAKGWYEEQQIEHQETDGRIISNKIGLVPNWDEYIVTEINSETTVIVRASSPKISNEKIDIIKSLVFSVKNGQVVSGNIILVKGESSFINSKGLSLVANFRDSEIKGLRDGAFIIYDINYNSISSHSIINGKKQALVSSITSSKASLKNTSKRIASTNSTQNEEGCIDWYWVVYSQSTGQVISETYLYTTCGNPGGDMTIILPNAPTPCTQGKTLLENSSFMSKWNEIRNNLSQNYESGYFFKSTTAGYSYGYMAGTANSPEINAEPTTPVDGFFHNHYTGGSGTTQATFSGSDIQYTYYLHSTGKMVNPLTFTTGVITSSGSYIAKIDDLSAFTTYGSTKNILTEQGVNTLDAYLMVWTSYYTTNNGVSVQLAQEMALTKMLAGSGISLFKMDGNNWKKIGLGLNDVIQYNVCP